MTTEITRENDRMLTAKELSVRLNVASVTLQQWRANYEQLRQGPPFILLGEGPNAHVRYPLSGVIKWEDSRLAYAPEGIGTVEAEYERQKAS
jgi:hypothetical protein